MINDKHPPSCKIIKKKAYYEKEVGILSLLLRDLLQWFVGIENKRYSVLRFFFFSCTCTCMYSRVREESKQRIQDLLKSSNQGVACAASQAANESL